MKRFPDMFRRPNTLDDFIIQEVSCYEPLGIRPGDKVLDVGANIGAFTRLALEAGAGTIIAIEPDPENCAQFRTNAAVAWPKPYQVILHEAAAIDGGGKDVMLPLYLNTGKNKGIHSMTSHRGRESIMVPTIDWKLLVEGFDPDVIKIDIEGGEYTLDLSVIPAACRAIAIELHLTKKHWRAEGAAKVLAAIKALGFQATTEKPDTSGKRWTSFYIFHRGAIR